MSKTKTSYEILLSCPGDLNDQIDIVRRCINRFNETVGRQNNVVLELKHWSTSSYPKSGQSGQETLNQEFVEDCDAAIAIFWSRFGTPTDEYGSGTEEEIQIMLDSHKQVFMYFCTKNLPYNSDLAEVKKIRDYKERYEKNKSGLYRCYDSDLTFEMSLSQDLMKWFIDLHKNEVLSVSKKNEDMNVDVVYANKNMSSKFDPLKFNFDIETMRTSAQSLINEIKSITLPQPLQKTSYIEENVCVSEEEKERICGYDSSISEIGGDFFNLGNLQINMLSDELVGKNNEKEKYKKIKDLVNLIANMEYCNQLLESIGDMNKTTLAVYNQSGIELQNVTIKMKINRTELFDYQKKFPVPNDELSASHVSKALIENIFSNFTQTRFYNPERMMLSVDAPVLSQKKHFERTINRIFCYDYIVHDDVVQLSLTMKFIKNNEKICFPTPLFFVKKDNYALINYEIICDNFESVKQGDISLNS